MVNFDDLYLICYNPTAGRGKSEFHAKKLERLLNQSGNTNTILVSNENSENINNFFMTHKSKLKGVVISIGGDGTLSTIVNSMLKNKINMPIAVYPTGTSNDFATFLKMPKNKNKFLKILNTTSAKNCDVAKVNDMYAINAIGSGNFSHAGTVFSAKAKKIFGKFAYYTKCFFSAFTMRSNRLKIKHDSGEVENDFLFYYIVNSRVAGGFFKFAPDAILDDGLYDFVGVKNCNFIQFCFLFLRVLFGTHHKSKHVEYFKSSKFIVESVGNNKKFDKSDIDGNSGPSHPLFVAVESAKIKVFSGGSI